MKRVAAITFTRADYNSFVPILRALAQETNFETQLIASGTHLDARFGHTVQQIEADGFAIGARINMPVEFDSAESVVSSAGVAMAEMGKTFARLKPHLILLVGDRLELIAAASAALAFRIPIAHVSGGDITEGAIDNQVRDAVTKMSHLHFVAMKEHADRVIQCGEEPWRVHVTGEPALDLLNEMSFMSRDELAASLGMDLKPPVIAVSCHPTTLQFGDPAAEVRALLAALKNVTGTFVLTLPNADVGHSAIVSEMRRFEAETKSAKLFSSLGPLRYYSLLSHADLMIGNSSSGIWESPSFRLPVVNIGDRQTGRIRAANVIDVPAEAEAIVAAIRRELQPGFRTAIGDLRNPYGDGNAAAKIVTVLKQSETMPCLLRKKTCFS